MAASINADNGVVSGSAGLKSTADSTGVLALQTNGTTAISIDASQAVSFTNAPTVTGGTANGVAYLNGSKVLTTGSALVFNGTSLGVGVTPSVQYSGIKSLQVGSTTNLFDNGASTKFYHNAYTAASGDETYLTNGYAQGYLMASNGQHQWYTAASGTAGNTFSFTQAMTLDASGNFGLGVTPSAWATYKAIDVLGYASFSSYNGNEADMSTNAYYNAGWKYKNTAAATLYQQDAGVHRWQYAGSGTAGNAITWTAAMTLDASGNLLVGGTSNATVGGTLVKTNIVGVGTASSSGGIGVSLPNSTAGTVYVSNSVTSAGTGWNHFVGQSGNGSAITTNNIFIYGNGNIQNANNSYGAISDAKLKENIVDATPKLDKLMQVRVRNYNLIGNYEKHKQIGVVAQELEQVFPSMVEETQDKDADGNDIGTVTKSVKYSVFVPMLIKALQEQQALITQLTARITALESA